MANKVKQVTVRPTKAPTAFGPFKKGTVLCLRAEGRWWDLYIPAGPEGYRNFAADVLDIDPVVAAEPFMRLMAIMPGKSLAQAIPIGREAHVTVETDGHIQFFANDVDSLYWNNWGEVVVKATECAADCKCPPEPKTPDRYKGLPGAWTLARDVHERTQGVLFTAFLALGACMVLAFSQQGRDLVRTVGEQDFGKGFGGQQVAFAVLLLFLAVQAWVWPRMVVTSNYGRNRKTWHPKWLLTWLPRVLGGAPFIFVFWALKENPASNTGLIAWLVGVGLAFFVFLIVRQDLGVRLTMRVKLHPELLKVGRLWVIAGGVIGVGAMIWAIFDPVGMGWWLGAPGVVFLGVGLIIPVLVTAIQSGAAARIPALAVLIGLAAWFSLTMDNHLVGGRIPHTPPIAVQDAERLQLGEAYRIWSQQAPTLPDAGHTKPLVLVASEGGASRAGYWTAEVLAALHEQTDGQLPRSLFAISSVSGGSVGAVGYAASVQDQPDLPAGKLRGPLTDFAGRDFLSPSLTGLLFPDLLQRFLPVALLPDRAAGLERGFETAWTRHCAVPGACADKDLLTRPFLSLGPRGAAWRPLVIVNGASEETGRQIVTSRIAFAPDQIDAQDFHQAAGRDVMISTAIHNGARFPWISPAGTLRANTRPSRHIVDGGYFEASGVEVVRQLAQALERVNAEGPKDNLKIIIVFIGYDGIPKKDKSRSFINEIGAPFVALFGSRNAHAAHLMRQLKIEASGKPADIDPYVANLAGPIAYQPVLLCDQPGTPVVDPKFPPIAFSPPMDWALSSCAKAYMRRAAGGGDTIEAEQKVCHDVLSKPIPCQATNQAAIAAIAGLLPRKQAAPSP